MQYVYAVNASTGTGYAVNVACEGLICPRSQSLVRNSCMCKGRVLGIEVRSIDIVGKPVVYRP